MLRATWNELTTQLLSLTELNRIYFNFILLAEALTDKGGEETGVPGEDPWRRASENATYESSKIQEPIEIWTLTLALTTG